MKHLVVLTGAGISAESGLSTFRDNNGLWTKVNAEELASIQGYRKDRAKVLAFYNERRKNLLTVEPNHAHRVLAELEKVYKVSIITQNVDDLHGRAGSTNVLHLHGELRKATGSNNPNDVRCIKEMPLDVPIEIGNKAADGSQLRPFIVFFGEVLRYDGIASDGRKILFHHRRECHQARHHHLYRLCIHRGWRLLFPRWFRSSVRRAPLVA